MDELGADDDESRITPPVFICTYESLLGGMGADERVCISMVAVTPSTGDVVWDEFEDGFMRNELEVNIVNPKLRLTSSLTEMCLRLGWLT